MIHPCDTPFQQSAKKAVLDACNRSFATLWNAKILTPESFQDFEGNIDLYTGARALAWEEIEKLQQRLRDAGWECRIRSIEGARDPRSVYHECREEEEPRFYWEEADHFEDGTLILRLALAKIPEAPEEPKDTDNFFNDVREAFFTPDGTLTEKGEQQVADEISSQVIRGKDGNAISKEGVKRLDLAIDLDMSKASDEQVRKMTEGLNILGETGEETK